MRITLSSEDELQGFYKYKSFEVIDLVVQDTLAPDSTLTKKSRVRWQDMRHRR